MKKLVLVLFVVALFSTTSSFAQLSVGGNLGLMIGTEEGSKAHFGGSVYSKYLITENIRLGANIGVFFYSEDGISSSIIPITASAEYCMLFGNLTPYAGIDLGLYSNRLSFKYNDIYGNSEPIKNVMTANHFGIAPNIGLDYKLSEKLFLNANFKFHLIFFKEETSKNIGLSLGIGYKL